MSTGGEVFTPHPNAVSPGYFTYDIVAGILTFVAAACVALRFVHRGRTSDYRWDDWAVLVSLIFDIGVLIGTFLISAPSIAGAGYHITTYTIPELNNYLKIALACDVLYNVSVAFSKASILLFYRRIFSVDGQFLLFMRIMGVLIVGNCLAAVFGLIFSDNPVQAQWNVGMPYTTFDDRAFWTTMAVINIVLDSMILGIAQLKVWKLHMSARRKLLISSVFLLGAFTIVTSILRIIYLLTVDLADLTYTLTTAGIWTNVEINLSIICACVPVIYSLLRIKMTNKRSTAPKSNTLVTIGSGPARLKGSHKRSQYLDNEVGLSESAYETIVETDGETHSMEPLAPIHVRKEYQVEMTKR